MAFAHAIRDKIEAAYRSGDLFEKRRTLTQAWADYVEQQVTAAAAKRRLSNAFATSSKV
ncbi:hypothetical protein [Burkholderia anthina]|uniref:hypothetical protein n=1 Tax=Burkholderia anthina TaxID=179879 RepID=UPI001FC7D08C|nr:hypothetical protein [Burkholderia anthina]